MVKLTPDLIKGFAGAVLAQRYDDPVATPDCHLEWWEMCCSSHRLVSLAAPRDHAKSTAITHAYLLAELMFRNSDFALIVSDTEKQAIEFLGDITKDLTENEDLINLFEIAGFEKETESEIIVRFKDGDKFCVMAKGAGQKVRGKKWEQRRPNLIIVDDLENDENVQTKEQRDKLRRWVNGALIPCLSGRGKLRAVGTIIHSASWLASTMPNESSPLTKQTPLKVYTKVLTHGWHSAKYRAHPGIGDYSKFLWPEHHGEAHYRAEYARAEADGQTDVYSAEHLNQPIDSILAYFRKTDFLPYPDKFWDNKTDEYHLPNLNYYAACDFAISKADRADFTVLVVVGVDEDGQVYLVDVVRGRFDPDESVNELFKLEVKYHPAFFVVEKGTLAHSIGAALNREMVKRHCYPALDPITTTGDKQTKARGIQKIMRGGGMYVNKQAEWYPAFEDELLRFPKAAHDDQVDAIALIGLIQDQLSEALTQEEQDEDEYDEEMAEALPQGRSPITGY